MNGYLVLTILILLDDGTRRYFALLHFETATIEINSKNLQFNDSRYCFKVSPRERKRVVLLMESAKFLLAALFVNSRRVDVSKFRVEISPI